MVYSFLFNNGLNLIMCEAFIINWLVGHFIFQNHQKKCITHFNTIFIPPLTMSIRKEYKKEVQLLPSSESFLHTCPNLFLNKKTFEPRHEISNNVLCATSKASDQPAHTRSLIRAFSSGLNIL